MIRDELEIKLKSLKRELPKLEKLLVYEIDDKKTEELMELYLMTLVEKINILRKLEELKVKH